MKYLGSKLMGIAIRLEVLVSRGTSLKNFHEEVRRSVGDLRTFASQVIEMEEQLDQHEADHYNRQISGDCD